jgi:hypothetical protein
MATLQQSPCQFQLYSGLHALHTVNPSGTCPIGTSRPPPLRRLASKTPAACRIARRVADVGTETRPATCSQPGRLIWFSSCGLWCVWAG